MREPAKQWFRIHQLFVDIFLPGGHQTYEYIYIYTLWRAGLNETKQYEQKWVAKKKRECWNIPLRLLSSYERTRTLEYSIALSQLCEITRSLEYSIELIKLYGITRTLEYSIELIKLYEIIRTLEYSIAVSKLYEITRTLEYSIALIKWCERKRRLETK